MITHAMLRFSHLLLAVTLCLATSSSAIDYQQLSAAKRLAADKRYDEAIQKLEALAAKTDEFGENYSYLSLAIEIAVDPLKNADRAFALAAAIKEPALRDFAKLRVLAEFQRYDEALAFVRDKNVESWPVRCRGQAHGILAGIFHEKKDDAAELAHWQLSAEAPGAEVSVRGRALRETGVLFQKQGNLAKAEEQFRKALEVTPANYAWRVSTLIGLSRLLIDQQCAKEAVKVFDGTDFAKVSSVTSKGNLLEAYARALLAAGKKIRAIETFDQLLQLDLPAAWKDRINKELDQMAEEF
jgi:tetratricopeptide (TPR) repeat protein